MWKLSETTWINPRNILYIYQPGYTEELSVFFIATGSEASTQLRLSGQAKQALLAFLSQHTIMHPPYIVRDDNDEPPF